MMSPQKLPRRVRLFFFIDKNNLSCLSESTVEHTIIGFIRRTRCNVMEEAFAD